jgi:hypothetical protein
MLQAMFIDLALVLAIFIIGFLLAALILKSDHWIMLLGLAFPLGAGLLTWFIFVLSWLGVPLSSGLIIGVISGCLMILLSLRHSRMFIRGLGSQLSHPRDKNELKKWITQNYGLLAVFGLFLIASGFAIGKSYSAWDATAIWSIKGYGIAYEGTVFAGDVWGAHRLFYPLNIPILISFFRLLSGDLLPGSKIVFPIFYLSTLLVSYAFWRRRGLRSLYANIGIVLLATIPDIFFHATIGYANLPMACYLVLGMLFGIDGVYQNNSNDQLMSGLLLGFAGWTRVEGILFDLAVILVILILYWFTKRGKVRWLIWLLPVSFIIGIWMVFYRLYGADISPAMRSLGDEMQSISQFDLGLDRIYTIVRYVLKIPINRLKWGYLFLVCPILILFNWRKLSPKVDPSGLALLLAMFGTGLAACLLFYVGSTSNPSGLAGWMVRSFPRAFFPTPLLTGILTTLLVGSPKVALHGMNKRGFEKIEADLSGRR